MFNFRSEIKMQSQARKKPTPLFPPKCKCIETRKQNLGPFFFELYYNSSLLQFYSNLLHVSECFSETAIVLRFAFAVLLCVFSLTSLSLSPSLFFSSPSPSPSHSLLALRFLQTLFSHVRAFSPTPHIWKLFISRFRIWITI